ncbi:thiamine pyrophosphate-dependent enzyme [Roseobacter sp. HKCCA0434]|uniref:thiamine pyrophosphate-dependent enzyme n=1 Tax=Roseobacter sp. HKCCA0434 TaxID=3079297 RepID=UPI0029059A77|nr:thiamine pyrophosphate-dependent enzyme [Roseobacter sp. HKCCA0434]
MDRTSIVETQFRNRLEADDLPAGPTPVDGLRPDRARALFAAQCQSRALDLTARDMQKAGRGFYTIGSSGHEGMAAVAEALRTDDMAFLHYRDAAFQLARAERVDGIDAVRDMLLSFACAADDPISGGRHKVLGSKALAIPPQTSTIASHLPKAMGAAYSIGLARRRAPALRQLAEDGIVMCSFGDASLNHSTAQGTINAACWTARQAAPLPLLFVCEDNGIGISTPTPKGWVADTLRARPGLRYFSADGCDLYATFAVARAAADYVRSQRRPAVLHLSTVRLYGHAGADLATSYLPLAQVEAEEARDPLLHSARLLRDAGVMSARDALALYDETRVRISALSEEVAAHPPLQGAAAVMSSILPPARPAPRVNGPEADQRIATFGADARNLDTPQPMSRLINWALTDLMLTHDEIVVMGEDVGRKGGVYGVTQRLQKRFGADRVVDTLLDEQSILGLALGLAHNGFVPMPEIQFLAYLHNAEDQLRGEAATLPFFSNGQFANPMVLRIAGLGYQKGFGGHFHNDNSLAVLRDIPGIVIACPSDGAEAAMMLRESVRLAREENRVVVFVEPIALYPMRDLMAEGDGGWMRTYPAPDRRLPLGEVGVHGEGTDLAIVTYGNGRYLSTQAQADLAEAGIDARIVDLRWLAPMPEKSLLAAIADCAAVLIVDECRRTGGQAEALMALFAERRNGPMARVTAEDSFIATGPAYASTLPSRDAIVRAARTLLGK